MAGWWAGGGGLGGGGGGGGGGGRWLRWFTWLTGDGVSVKETAFAMRAFALYLSVMAAYFNLQPLRDQLGWGHASMSLPWLFNASMLATLCINPLFSALYARVPPHRVIPAVYRFFGACLLGFFAALRLGGDDAAPVLASVFFLWTGVVAVVVNSTFWSFASELLSPSAAARTFGIVAAGGTLGQIMGSWMAALLTWQESLIADTVAQVFTWLGSDASPEDAPARAARTLPPVHFLVSAALFELSARLFAAIVRDATIQLPGFGQGATVGGGGKGEEGATRGDGHARPSRRGGAKGGDDNDGSMLSGIQLVLASPAMGSLAAYVFLSTWAGSSWYFAKAAILSNPDVPKSPLLALLNAAAGTLTFVCQLVGTAHIVRRLGVSMSLIAQPVIAGVAFFLLARSPTVATVAALSLVRRLVNYAISKPCREALFTATTHQERYLAKNLIDSVVHRLGDACGASAVAFGKGAGWFGAAHGGDDGAGDGTEALVNLGVVFPAVIVVPWFFVSVLFGRLYRQRVTLMSSPHST